MPAPARWLARRLLASLLVVWGTATLAFAGMALIPGDPARAIAGGVQATASPQVLDAVREAYGLDNPWWVRYTAFLGRLVRGDLGYSYQLDRPVAEVVGEQFGASAALALGGAALGLGLAVGLALLTAGRPRLRALAHAFEFVSISTPSFWIGVLLLAAFAFGLGWFPVLGGNGLAALVLPWATLGLSIAGLLAQVTREGLERALDQPFALTVLARGASGNRLRLRHALRHACLPVLTLSGWVLGNLMGGVVVVEAVFARQGVGRVLVSAVNGRDLPVVIGVAILGAVVFSLIGIVLDLVYRVVDPRLREEIA
ncbi:MULTISPECIES: ABC transporter permease [unclassified Nocardiopsis]|uniref:ABC transporter permease n=1 Tax=Nocardiopsis TaxID=2013 RepID=UPI00387AA3B8